MAAIPQPEGAAAPSLRAVCQRQPNPDPLAASVDTVQAHQAAVRTAARMRQENGAQTEYCPCLPASAGQVPAPPEQPATVARWPVTVSAVKQHELGLMVRAGDCLRPAGRPVSLPAGSPPAPVGCHSAHGAAAVPAAAHAAGRSGSATVTYVLAGTLGWSRVWDGPGPGSWWCDCASMPVGPGSLCFGRGSRLLLAAWIRAASPVRA